MDFISQIAVYLYSDGNLLLTACKVIAFIFSLESLSYLVGIVMGVAKTACR